MMKLIGTGAMGAAAAILVFVGTTSGARAQAGPDNRLHVVSATYGAPGASHVRDFSDRLSQTCGDQAVTCESFCSKTLVGASSSWMRMPFSARPVCRVIYRCGEGVTRATETDSDELIMLNCKRDH